MAVQEALQPLDNTKGMPIDPNVRVPDSVTRAARAAEAMHTQAYVDPAKVAAEAAAKAEADRAAHEAATQAAAKAEADRAAQAAAQDAQDPKPVAAQPEPQPEPLKPEDQNITAEEWRHRYLSMQGRFHAAQRDKGAMEEQMRQLAQELINTQNLLQKQVATTPVPQPRLGQPHENLITAEDRENYGDSLIDMAQRAAKSAVAPELEALRAENERLTNQVKTTTKRELFGTLDGRIPNWRAINQSTQFKSWLRLRNVYTGQIRSEMLKAAVDGAEAPKVIALFQDFLSEAHATGQLAPAPQTEQRAPQPDPRTPAVNLETLAAPGRARPASGEGQMPTDKPIYTRAQISKFFDDSRRGLYAGREAEYAAIHADLSKAQAEGRIR